MLQYLKLSISNLPKNAKFRARLRSLHLGLKMLYCVFLDLSLRKLLSFLGCNFGKVSAYLKSALLIYQNLEFRAKIRKCEIKDLLGIFRLKSEKTILSYLKSLPSNSSKCINLCKTKKSLNLGPKWLIWVFLD